MTPKADLGKITGKPCFFKMVHGNAGFVDKVVFQVCFVHQETDFVEKSVNCILRIPVLEGYKRKKH